VSTLLPAKRSWFRLICGEVLQLGPGILAAFGLASLAIVVGKLIYGSGASPLMLAVLLGIVVRMFVGAPATMQAGVRFAQKRLLRFAIILLGVQLTFTEMTHLSAAVLGLIIATVTFTFVFSCWIGRLLGVPHGLNQLIAAGASICGISAIVASNTVVQASDEDVAYAIATATAFGTLSIISYPLLAAVFSMEPNAYAVWVGTSVHEVAQVIAAGFLYGAGSGELAVVVKLTRVLLLAPMVLTLGWLAMRRPGVESRRTGSSFVDTLRNIPLPLFIVGFVLMIAINSFGLVPQGPRSAITFVSAFLFAMALAALGLETDLRKLKEMGPRPLIAGAVAWVFISVFGLALVSLLANGR
jgi:uncharacterized integral membrane protein (TIGR00698 family)